MTLTIGQTIDLLLTGDYDLAWSIPTSTVKKDRTKTLLRADHNISLTNVISKYLYTITNPTNYTILTLVSIKHKDYYTHNKLPYFSTVGLNTKQRMRLLEVTNDTLIKPLYLSKNISALSDIYKYMVSSKYKIYYRENGNIEWVLITPDIFMLICKAVELNKDIQYGLQDIIPNTKDTL